MKMLVVEEQDFIWLRDIGDVIDRIFYYEPGELGNREKQHEFKVLNMQILSNREIAF